MPKVKVVDLVQYHKTNAPCWAMHAGKGDCDYYVREINENRKAVEETWPFYTAQTNGVEVASWRGWTWSAPAYSKRQTDEHTQYYGGPRWAVVFEADRNELGEISP